MYPDRREPPLGDPLHYASLAEAAKSCAHYCGGGCPAA